MTATEPVSLTRWSRTWRFVLMVVISATSWAVAGSWRWGSHVWLWLDLGLGAAGFVLVRRRRRHPVLVAVFTAVAGAVSGSVAGPATLALMSLATRRRWREIVPVSLLTALASVTLVRLTPGSEDLFVEFFLALAFVGVVVGWGLYVGSHRELLSTLRERAVRAESEQALRLQQARDAERSRIAREMHDVLAHRISLVAMHSGALTFRDDLSVDQVREAAEVIQTNAHLAMAELREVLGLLRSPQSESSVVRPQPSARDILAVVADARAAGLKVELEDEVTGAPAVRTLSEVAGRTAFRVVQEGLTNVRKHAPSTRVVVRLTGSARSGLTVELHNPLQIGDRGSGAPSSGLGLVGLSERVSLAGGRLTHVVTAGHVFVLRAQIPWQA